MLHTISENIFPASWLVAAIVLSIFYIIVMVRYISGWRKLKIWVKPDNFKPITKVSVIIAARNEEEKIEKTLNSVKRQTYPENLYEIIVVDDFSEDNTADIVEKAGVKLIKLSDYYREEELKSFKKKAIATGIDVAQGDLIVTTDADCIAGERWLETLISFYENNNVKIFGAPVNFYDEKNLFEKFQSLDFLGMMGVTGAGISTGFMSMANGANLAYEKKIFDEIGGFDGIDTLSSGDDILLMQKIAKKYPHRVGFVKNTDATVFTKAEATLKGFISQRIRWATKSSGYSEKQTVFVLAGVFLFTLSITGSLVLIPFFPKIFIAIFLLQFFIKMSMDYFFLNSLTKFFLRKDLMKVFFPSLLLHVFYIVFIGIAANLKKKYNWKGRKTI